MEGRIRQVPFPSGPFRNPVPSCADSMKGQVEIEGGMADPGVLVLNVENPSLCVSGSCRLCALLLQRIFAASRGTASNPSSNRRPFPNIHGPILKKDSELSCVDSVLHGK